MTSRDVAFLGLITLALFQDRAVLGDEVALRQIKTSSDAQHATVRIHAANRAAAPIPREITGKFAEHLGFNIYNGMDAQILRNPTLADYPFWTGQMSPDGVTRFHAEENRIKEELRRQARRFGWPESDLDGLVQSYTDAAAAFWTRIGDRHDVTVSPDTGPQGGRAQRIQVKAAGQGLAQWTWLPLHRQRDYEFELLVRAPDIQRLTVSIWGKATNQPLSVATVSPVSTEWHTFRGQLSLPADAPAANAYRFTVTADAAGQFVLGHAFLRPADHIHGADPDVVRLLKESGLPLLRWPGGNFVSTYHWEDGVGPVEQRPTKPNFAWGAIEPNTFGTDEFIAFCLAVGCEPMICINAGSGTPEEAARWIEYCNGPVTSAMGRLRAANGHPEPYGVKRWEVGNELWGHWQMSWTTAPGYVDRYKPFASAMLAADPSITLYACGAPAMSGEQWNDTLIAGLGPAMKAITDHPLIGGDVPSSAEPLDVYRDFMAVPEVLEQKWRALRDAMLQGGISSPTLAVTELQLFAHLKAGAKDAPVRLIYETMPSQGSITEAIYDVLVYHAAIRLDPFVQLITHSAVINHGGGLRKERERVWANPCHYAQTAFASFGGATPVPVEIESTEERALMVLPDLKNATSHAEFSALDALAAVAADGSLLVSLVHRGATNSLRVTVAPGDFAPASKAELHSLSADAPWKGNTLEQPDLIKPIDSEIAATDGRFEFELRPYTVARLRIPAK